MHDFPKTTLNVSAHARYECLCASGVHAPRPPRPRRRPPPTTTTTNRHFHCHNAFACREDSIAFVNKSWQKNCIRIDPVARFEFMGAPPQAVWSFFCEFALYFPVVFSKIKRIRCDIVVRWNVRFSGSIFVFVRFTILGKGGKLVCFLWCRPLACLAGDEGGISSGRLPTLMPGHQGGTLVLVLLSVGLVYWGLTPQQQPGSYQGGEMMMMKSVFWWRKPEYPEEPTDLRQVGWC